MQESNWAAGSHPVDRNWYCKLMIILCVHNSAASKVDVATQTDAMDDNMKTKIISTEPIVSPERSQRDW